MARVHPWRSDAKKAAERIIKAIEENQSIVIYSDYDADGIPAGVLFHDFFKKINFKNFINYIPHRHDEGFGLNVDAVNQFIKDKVNLLITLDCGISDIEAVKVAKENGIDVIITDHHEPHEELPHDLLYEDLDGQQIKLLTCDGVWSAQNKNYSNRLVVAALLKEVR
jgi:single-stranded-DNA-specific exonuclease